MQSLALRHVDKSYGDQPVLRDVTVSADPGEFLVLLGPSGCGKSTLLHAIAGLQDIDRGEIAIDGQVINEIPTRDRDIAMVFQSYALYPNMTVRENIGFPLKMRRVPPEESQARVADVVRMLQIEHLLERWPRQLSGGQRQRVAIGRSLVRDPKIFLFDEPLSNLDASLRAEMRIEIKRLHQNVGKTMVYVTHDQIEAMTLATRIVVMDRGRIQQIGAPADIYHRPANLFVAKFIGSPTITLLTGRVEDRGGAPSFVLSSKDKTAETALSLPQGDGARRLVGAEATLGIRPEHIHLAHDGSANCRAMTEVVEPTGPEDIVLFSIGGQSAVARVPTASVAQGAEAGLRIDMTKALLFDPRDGARVDA